MNRVFLIAPTHMDLYKDIVRELERQGYKVDFLSVKTPTNDPFFLSNRYHKFYSKRLFLYKLEKYWDRLYDSNTYSFDYDYLIVINGNTLHPKLFYYLKQHNPRIKCINYIYDSIQHVYRLNRNFDYFDNIFTFDFSDSKRFGLNFLPIYWSPQSATLDSNVDVFGFGAYSRDRFHIFQKIKVIAKNNGLRTYIKLYKPQISNVSLFKLKNKIKSLFSLPIDMTFEEYDSELISHNTLSPDLFRAYLQSSKVIVDTCNRLQEGMTARFMWALGAGKKIITTNKHIRQYSVYSPDQICVIDENVDVPDSFFTTPFVPTEEYYNEVNKWRIDNWVKTLINL